MRKKRSAPPKLSPKLNLSILQTLPKLGLSKATLRQIDIIEASIHCYSNFGVEETTFDKIAKQAKLSRSLIFHYFNDKTEIFDAAINYVRASYQDSIVEKVSKARNAEEAYQLYIDASLDWVKEEPSHYKLWYIFLHRCSIHTKYQKINDEMVAMGLERISGLISELPKNKKLNSQQIRIKAKCIQAFIIGSLVQLSTEGPNTLPKKWTNEIKEHCWKIAH